MSSAPSIPGSIEVDADGRLTQDLTCGGCGYNLRGVQLDAACPECGDAVRASAREDLLRFADPRWLRKLVAGVICLFGALAVTLAFYLGVIALATLYGPWIDIEVLALIVLGSATIGFVVGVWLCTSRPAPGRWPLPTVAARVVAALAPVFLILMSTVGDYVVNTAQLPIELKLMITAAFSVGFFGCLFAALMFLTVHAGTAAARIPEKALVRRCRRLTWAIGVVVVATLINGGVQATSSLLFSKWGTTPRWANYMITTTAIGYGILALLVFIGLLIVGIIMLRRLLTALRQARQHPHQTVGALAERPDDQSVTPS